MISAREAVVWVDVEAGEVLVWPREGFRRPDRCGFPGHWSDPIGAAYSQWHKMTNAQRVRLMLETALDLAM
jgi:hypothetical protein